MEEECVLDLTMSGKMRAQKMQVRPCSENCMCKCVQYTQAGERFPAPRYHSWSHTVNGSFATQVLSQVLEQVRQANISYLHTGIVLL